MRMVRAMRATAPLAKLAYTLKMARGGSHLERPDVDLERVEVARAVLGFADRARPEPGAGTVAHGVVERGAHDRHVGCAGKELDRVRDPGQCGA